VTDDRTATAANSSLYECVVMHNRLTPRRHAFAYRLFMFALDLDGIGVLRKKLRLFGRKAGVFTYREKDHIAYPGLTTKESVVHFLRTKGVTEPIQRVLLVTHLRTFGYVFNPVSFYFCFGPGGRAVCSVAEVNNTFGEMKPYLVGAPDDPGGGFRARHTKHFYVSPFIRLDAEFDFRFQVPGDDLKLYITDYEGEERIIATSLVGKRRELTDARLAWYAVRFPLITLRVIGLIHWQAFRLYLKKIPHIPKAADPHLQKEIFNVHSS
jgi:DUF1365 family protein